jgi:hypothetical protein
MKTMSNIVALRTNEFHHRRHESLLKRAEKAKIEIEPDYVHPAAFIAREAACIGYCNVVTRESCTCPEFRGWGDCPHHAMVVAELAQERQEVAS